MQTDTIQRALEGAIHRMYRTETNGQRRMRQWFTFRFELMKRRISDEVKIRDLERKVARLQAENAMLREDTSDGDTVFDAMLTRRAEKFGEIEW